MSTMGKLFEWARPHKKHVYYLNEGSLDEQHILGAKGANLCEMFRLGMPVPPAFIITADNSMEYFKAGMSNKGYILPQELMADIKKGVIELEHQTNKKFGLGVDQVFDGTPKIPLLLSVRAGSAISMPGMMDTVLNLGINEFVTEHMGKHLNNQRWAFDTYRRFLQMFGTVVLGIDKKRYDNILREMLKSRDVPHESLLSITDMKEVIARFKKIAAVPDDPWEQLDMAIQAVFRSWNSPLAMKYRDINNIPSEYGTAVTVQSMVFGNLNTQSGSGVAFTRNPTTGVKELYGEYLPCSEGEDVSGGLRTPTPLSEMRQQMPTIFDSLMHVERILEKHYRDMQNIEFTVENKVLYILETRAAKRTAQASVCVAVEMVKERMITEREALLRIDASQMDFFLHQMLDYNQVDTQDPQISSRMLCRGAPASPGAAVGAVVFSVAEAMQCALNRTPCILISNETSISDMEGFRAATGMLTMCGGVTSHAAVMMRSLGKPGVVGAQNLTVDWDLCTLTSTANPELIVRTGDTITVDGSQGVVYIGEMPTVSTGTDANFLTVMHWANKYKRMSVLANADTVTQISTAGRLGAEGIGSCRTERMFAHPDCLTHFRRMILSDTTHDRATSLLEMLPRQQEKFLEMFRLVGDHPIVIRLLDPPLHEFLPSPRSSHFDKEIREMAAKIDLPYEVCLRRVMELQQSNPMLGFRGCRLSILYPEITEMQTRAIVGASIQARNENIQVKPQIVIPQVFTDHEVDIITPVITAAANSVFSQMGTRHDLASLQITIGAMIETPRACIRADRIAEAKDISFIEMGSNDLTQLVFGICRQDSHMFMPTYQNLHLVAQDPHMTLDIHGVGGMIQMAVRRCRRVNKNMRVGLTGEHAGDPQSITFFDRMGADYLSCSPFRVPIAKVAAAQAHIEETAIQRHREVEQQRQLLLAPFPMGAYMYGPVFLPKSHYDY